jgi:CTP synthase (UTP-ammonia lyase)
MGSRIRIGIIADYDPKSPYHAATANSLMYAGEDLSVDVEPVWLETGFLATSQGKSELPKFDGLFCGPGSPYRSMDGALDAIRFARENDWPFIGT